MTDVKTDKINGLHVSVHTPRDCQGYLLYVHGGPGSHSAYFEHALQAFPDLVEMPYGWICYDQRNCGRSESHSQPMTHTQNICDLDGLIADLKLKIPHPLIALVGHSYGARIVCDLFKRNPDLTARVILLGISGIPLLAVKRSLIIDLLLLKEQAPDIYAVMYQKMRMSNEGILSFLKQVRCALKDTDGRLRFYWANPETRNWYVNIRKTCNIKDRNDTFVAVFKTIYSPKTEEEKSPALDIAGIQQPILWINGFHDFLMGGESNVNDEVGSHPIILFKHSGHYPHYEEPARFKKEVLKFLEQTYSN